MVIDVLAVEIIMDRSSVKQSEIIGIFECGGSKGYAHIGALKEMEERNICFSPDYALGFSIIQ